MPAIKANEPVQKGTAPQPTSEEPFLGTWKDKAAAEEGLANLNKVLDSQGNELGVLRQQTEFFKQQLQGIQQQQAPAAQEQEIDDGPDLQAESQAIQDTMSKLDPDDPGYQEEFATLLSKNNAIISQLATKQALDAAQAQFKSALDERDVERMHNKFFESNPDFNEPEMQQRIQEYLENDQTGMSDPMVAYREIQRDDAMVKAKELEDENIEMKRLLDLKEGEQSTGKVITKGQSPNQQTKPQKVTGAALDQGMMEALQKVK